MPALTPFLYAFAALAGALLVLAAWPLSQTWTPALGLKTVFLGHLLLFVIVADGLFVRMYAAKLPAPAIRRVLVALLTFSLTILPWNRGQAKDLLGQSMAIAGVLLLYYGIIHWRGLHPWLEKAGRALGRHRLIPPVLFCSLAATAFTGLAVYLSWYCFSWLPAYTDSTAQYVHARFMADGQLYGQSHPLRQFFPIWMMVNDGKWYAQYQPLHIMLLALGHLAGMPWLVVPLCGGITVALIYLLTRRIASEAPARIAALLALGSMFMLILSAEFMNHASTLLFITLFMYCHVACIDAFKSGKSRPAWLWGLAAGLAIGGAFLIRPFTAIGLGLPFMAHIGWLLWKHRRRMMVPALAMIAGGTLCLVFQFWYNDQLTGQALMFTSARYHNGSSTYAMGFSAKSTVASVITHGLTKASNEWRLFNVTMFEWPLPALFFIMLLALRPLKNTSQRLLLASIVTHTLVNMLNQFVNNAFGPRYLYETSAAVVILSAIGLNRMPALLPLILRRPPVSRPAVHAATALTLALLFAAGAAWRLPDTIRRYSSGYIDNHPDFYYSLLKQSRKPALIFIGRFYAGDRPRKDETIVKNRWLAFTNPPRDDADVIFAIDLGDTKNRKLMDYYPGRHVYLEHKHRLIPVRPALPPPSRTP